MNPTVEPSRTALVTGGAGFIGHRLVRGLLAAGWRVVVLDDLSTGRRDLLPDHPDLLVHEASILDPPAMRAAAEGVDVVFHLAAQVSVPESVADPGRTQRINVDGMRAVLAAARDARVRAVVFTSSCSVYGEPDGIPIREDAALRPMSPYANSKMIGEEMGYAWARDGAGFAALRLFNVYGAGQHAGGAYAAVIAAFAGAAASGGGPRIFGDGTQTRDFVHVEDVVSALISTAEHVLLHGSAGPYNVGTGRAVSLVALWDAVAGVTGSPDAPRFLPPREGDILHSCSDPTALAEEIGWEASLSLVEGLSAMLGGSGAKEA
jgi:UDP-glucose 4-epimerase